jgi:hypothetical protein
LVNKKFEQFRDLCKKNLQEKLDELNNPNKILEFRTLDDDLAGFWDMLCIQVDDVRKYFNELNQLKDNNWIQQNISKPITIAKIPNVKIKTSGNTNTKSASRSDESRKRIIEAKRNAMLKQQQSLSADDVDIVFFEQK